MLRALFLLGLFLSGLLANCATAQDTFSRVSAGGQFGNASSWSPYNPPFTEGPGGINDDVRFDLGFSPGNRYLIENVFGDNNQLIVENDSVTLELIGYELHDPGFNNDTGIIVGRNAGDQGDLLLRADALPNSTLDVVNVVLGLAENSSGTLTVNDPDLDWNNSGVIQVGGNGQGTLNVIGGAEVDANAVLAGAIPTSSGSIQIEGTGSRLNTTFGLGVGAEFFGSGGGAGELSIFAGGEVVVGSDAVVGDGPSGIGSATISGAGSLLDVAESLSVGFASSILIENGGSVDCSACESNGSATLSGPDSQLDVTGLLSCRGLGVQGGAIATCSDSIIYGNAIVVDGAQSELNAANMIDIRSPGAVANGGRLFAGSEIRLTGLQSGSNFNVFGQNSRIETSEFVVGESFPVCLTVSNKAQVACETAVIPESSVISISETLIGSESSWISNHLSIGNSGAGVFRIQTGSTVSCDTCNVGGVDGQGLIDVQDFNSVLIVTDQLRLGTDNLGGGSGILSIDDGAEVEIANQLFVDDESLVLLTDGRLVVSSIDLMPEGEFAFTGGVLQVELFDGDLVNAGGVLAPGIPAGITTIAGEYVQQSAGTMQIEIGGTAISDYDFVDIGGALQLDGQLNIELMAGFQPTQQQQFTIAMANNITGSFANAADNQRVDTTDGSGSFLVRYGPSSPNPNQIVLSQFEPAFVLGDVNGDGEVNLLDVGPFVELLSSGSYDPAADINMDGQVNLLDVGLFVALLGG